MFYLFSRLVERLNNLRLLRRSCKFIGAGALALSLAAIGSGKAMADDVDTVVDAVVSVGSIAGIPVDASDAAVIKIIVRCAASNNAIVRCAREVIIDQLPPETRPFSACILNGTALQQCAPAAVLQRLPAPVRQVIVCMSQRTDVGACGKQAALSAAQQHVFGVIDKLKADGRSDVTTELDAAQSGSIRNIIGLSRAIGTNDWVSVITFGGPEVYKAAAKIVLKAVLPEIMPASLIVDPIINVIIQARADVVAKVIAGARNRDAHLVGEAITEAYLVDGILVPCALPAIPDEVREAVCGRIGKIIHSIADAGGDATAFVVSLIKDPLGIPGSVWDELVKLEQTVFLNKKHDCGPPELYYANNYARCYHRGVRQLALGKAHLNQLVSSLNNRCRGFYDRCFTSSHFDDLCNPQQAMFANHASELVASVNRAAGLYAESFAEFVREKGQAAACDRPSFMSHAFQEFLDRCAREVAVHVPLAGNPDSDDCDRLSPAFSAPVAHRAACERAMAQVDTGTILGKACAGKPQAPTACHALGSGRCGFLDIQCAAPLPAVPEFIVTGTADLKVIRAVPEIGLINAQYTVATGDFSANVCARNAFGGAACSADFSVSLGSSTDHSCFGPPVHRQCPSSMKICRNRCVGKNDPCPQLQ